jgi:hypothetical protein
MILSNVYGVAGPEVLAVSWTEATLATIIVAARAYATINLLETSRY